jgi:hypothetical protein
MLPRPQSPLERTLDQGNLKVSVCGSSRAGRLIVAPIHRYVFSPVNVPTMSVINFNERVLATEGTTKRELDCIAKQITQLYKGL